MKNILELNWKTITLSIVLFYVIGDIYFESKVLVKKGINKINLYQQELADEAYRKTDKYKLEQIESEIDNITFTIKTDTYELIKENPDLYSKSEMNEAKQEYDAHKKTLDSLNNQKLLLTNDRLD